MSDHRPHSGAADEPAPGGGVPPQIGAAAEAAAELPRKAADAVQLVVDTIHDKAIRPVVLAARALVFGLVVAALSTLLLVMGSIAILRLFDVYAFAHRVWLSYVVLGAALTLTGLAAWSRRTARPASSRAD
jgi:hypothetical protein